MDEELQQPEPKIGIVSGIFGLLIAVALDIISLIPGGGDVEDIPMGIVFVLNWVFGGLGGALLAVQGLVMVLKAIPIVQELPLWTPAWCYTWYTLDHPSIASAALEKVGQAEAVVEGGEIGEAGALAEEAGAAEGAAASAAAAAEAEEEAVELEAAEGAEAAEGGTGGESEASKSGRPSDEAPTKDRRERGEERPDFGGDEYGEPETEEEEKAKADEFAAGAEINPEEEAEEEAFSPKELEFKEGHFGAGDAREEGAGSTAGKETEAQKEARKKAEQVKMIREQFQKLRSARPKDPNE